MIVIRKAAAAELDAVVSSRIEMLKVVNDLPLGTEFDQEVIDNIREYFKNGNQSTVLAIDDEVIGCATICYITVSPTLDHPAGKRAHIMNVFTRAKYRRQGIAERMLELLIAEAKQKGVTEISLDATSLGQPLYEKCGFVKNEEGMLLVL